MEDEPLNDFWVTAGHVFEPTAQEEAFCGTLPAFGRGFFRLFLIGNKFQYNNRNQDPYTWRPMPPGETVRRWQQWDAARTLRYIDRGRIPDPRLDESHLRAHNVIHTAVLRIANEHIRFDFVMFAVGWKACHLTYALDARMLMRDIERRIIRTWNFLGRVARPARERYIRIGRRVIVRRERNLTHDHFYVPGFPLPAPTENDTIYVMNDPAAGDRPDESEWRFVKTLSQGAHIEIDGRQTHRIVHLYILVDREGIILQRMVVKIIGMLTMAQLADYMRHEYATHSAVSEVENPNILTVYGCSLRPRVLNPQLGYIYMEYAPHGTLLDYQNRVEDDPLVQIPEGLMWVIFRGLLEALYTHQTGKWIRKDQADNINRLNDQIPKRTLPGGNIEDWDVVVNPNMNTGNVVFGEELPYFYAHFKTPKVIDYRDAFFENPIRQYVNPQQLIADPGWGPPEQIPPPLDLYSRTPVRIHSNIYNVGQIMMSLMEGTHMPTPHHGGVKISHSAGYRKMYSAALENTVSDCLNLRADDRPTLDSLLFRTFDGLNRWKEVYGDPIRDEDELIEHQPHWWWDFDDDEFRIGDEAPEHLRRRRAWEDENDEADEDDEDYFPDEDEIDDESDDESDNGSDNGSNNGSDDESDDEDYSPDEDESDDESDEESDDENGAGNGAENEEGNQEENGAGNVNDNLNGAGEEEEPNYVYEELDDEDDDAHDDDPNDDDFNYGYSEDDSEYE